jgi:hypothetical protein
MSSPHPRSLGVHPAVLERRLRELLVAGAAAAAALAAALAISLLVPHPNLVLLLAIVAGALGLYVLVANSRLEVTVTLLALYLCLLDGPVKLLSGGGTATSALRNVLILGVALGALGRLLAKREPIKLPPLTGWMLALLLLVLVEAANPNTGGFLHFLGGFRQQLQRVPFFFFAYVLMRDVERFRKFFLILGVVALANGIVATYQTRLSPTQIAGWGPGYHQRVYGTTVEGKKKGGGRVYVSEGEGRIRPLALGSDSGFGGGVGVVALPGTLALMAMWRGRRRWIAVVLSLGAMVAVATCLGRLQVVGAVLAVLAFALLSSTLGRRMTRPVVALLAVGALALPLGALFVSAEGAGTFKRYENIAPEKAASTSTGYKANALGLIPHEMTVSPFGVGLGSVGSVSGFGGRSTELLEGHGVSSETQFNLMADELGLPGLIWWTAFSLYVILLATLRVRRIEDPELGIALAGVFAPLIALFLMGFSGPIVTSAASGPYVFFAAGIASYWLLGPGRARVMGRSGGGR